MYDKIKQDIVTSMKEKDTLKIQTLRGVKGEIDLEHINKKVEITDELTIDVLARQIKTRKESIEEFKKGNRLDLIEKTTKEIELLKNYLPKQLTTDELNQIIDEVFLSVNPTSSKEMGLIMKELTPLVKGKCDMKEVSVIIKDKLSNL
ncbi:MAG: GatB/YqeY domain-containing protein [Bacilli bacterium]|nr:GatB/YqeY domain-containing protein [Bacilli bacterium]